MLLTELSSEVNRSVSLINYDSLLLTGAQVYIDKEERWIFIILFLLCELILLLRWLGWDLFSVQFVLLSNRRRFPELCWRKFFLLFVSGWYLHWWFLDWWKSMIDSAINLNLLFLYFFGLFLWLASWATHIAFIEWTPMSLFKHGCAEIAFVSFLYDVLFNGFDLFLLFLLIILFRWHCLNLIHG